MSSFLSAACEAFGWVDLWDGNRGVHGLCEGVLERAGIGPAEDAFLVRVKLHMSNLLVVGANDGMVVGSRILTEVSIMASIAYEWKFAMEIMKFVSWEGVSFLRCEIMWDPSDVGKKVGGAAVYSWVMVLVDLK